MYSQAICTPHSVQNKYIKTHHPKEVHGGQIRSKSDRYAYICMHARRSDGASTCRVIAERRTCTTGQQLHETQRSFALTCAISCKALALLRLVGIVMFKLAKLSEYPSKVNLLSPLEEGLAILFGLSTSYPDYQWC